MRMRNALSTPTSYCFVSIYKVIGIYIFINIYMILTYNNQVLVSSSRLRLFVIINIASVTYTNSYILYVSLFKNRIVQLYNIILEKIIE